MRRFTWVVGRVAEVQRFINVPVRWCEQYPARERRELWVSTAEGEEFKLVVHSKLMPARRGHQVIALLLGGQLVALLNLVTGEQVTYLRSDPPLLWRRCEGVAAKAAVAGGAMGFATTGGPVPLLMALAAAMAVPGLVIARWASRVRARIAAESAMREARRQATPRLALRRVK